MKTSNATITVKSAFGADKQVTKEEFIDIWGDYAKQLHAISTDRFEEIRAMVDRVREIAAVEFMRISSKQQ